MANVTGGINLGNGQTLTLNGSAGSQFVINSPSMTLNSGKIALTGGVTANDVNGDKRVNVVDVQIVVNAVLNLGCTG